MKLKQIFLSSVFILSCIIINAQEVLKPLGANINISRQAKSTAHQQASKTSSITPLDLPIFEDFSYSYKSSYPSVSFWADSSVYINQGYGIAPPNFGVATFDGLNKNGYPYDLSASVSTSASADTLTSLPINLKQTGSYVYTTASDVFLSFYYQAEGNGDSPEPLDSLCVDFFKPRQNKWSKVWGKAGYNPSAVDTNFYFVKIAVNDTAYLDSTFQFRFRNKATTSGSLDHWHIDYVYMKRDFTNLDTLRGDVGLVYMPTSFLKNYWAIPYTQYTNSEKATTFYNFFRNNYSGDEQANYKFNVYDEGMALLGSQDMGPFSFPGAPPFVTSGYYSGVQAKPSVTIAPFPSTLTIPTNFKIEHITTKGTVSAPNDTVIQLQKFYNYYAYDDGSAEVGYYLNYYGAKTAMKFTLNKNDTLKSVNIFFDPIIDGSLIQSSSFRLMVWDGNGGSPGSVILRDSTVYPIYIKGGYNVFPNYKLTTCLPLNSGTYYIGIQQTSNKGLNIGFDKNTNHSDALYYDIGNGWVQSAIKGSLMINPVLGCADIQVGVKENKNIADEIIIYPNPAQDKIIINNNNHSNQNFDIVIYSVLGEIVYKGEHKYNETIDTSSLPNGVYYISLSNNTTNVSTKKIIISR